MSSREHIGWEAVLDLVEGKSRPSRGQAAHLDRCAACRKQWREAENLLGAIEMASSPVPSDETVEAAWRQVQHELGGSAATTAIPGTAVPTTAPATRARSGRGKSNSISGVGPLGAIKEIWASLATGFLTPAHALRGGSTETPEVRVYEAGDYAVSLSLRRQGHATRCVLGRIVPKAAAGLPPGLVVLRVGQHEQSLDPGPHGGFRFDDVPEGSIQLDVRLGDDLIHVPVSE